MTIDLAGILQSTARPNLEENSRYYVKRISGASAHFFGWSGEGLPVLLLAAEGTLIKEPLRLAGLEVQYSIPCDIMVSETENSTDTLTTIKCNSTIPAIQTYFVRASETIVRIVGGNPDIQQVSDAVDNLVEIFQRLSRPSTRSARGVFAELLVIHLSTSPHTAIRAWHSAAEDRFDFSIGDVRLEVKSAASRQRVHNFSFEQCVPPSGTVGVLASLFVEGSGGGLTLLELVQRIEAQLSGNEELMLKLHETVAECLGSDTADSLALRFDEELATSSYQVYTLEDIPAIRECVPGEVSNIHFRSDISRTTEADVGHLASQSAYARALLPSAYWASSQEDI